MTLQANSVVSVFRQSVLDWHKKEAPSPNPFPADSVESILYSKNQIDTIQWHVEDEIRRPDLPDKDLVGFKRQIDKLNQERTDLVEILDDRISSQYKDVARKPTARMNSETPAWLIDRMSILELKIYHMEEQTQRKDADQTHIDTCKKKLEVLLEQRVDLSRCLDELLDDLQKGDKFYKVYRQMKMYNDQNLNPSLYSKKS
ncbi:DUF4254 domain-containing protein [Leptospira gomenensis]|uniref:DUF4254 domain-containing protein n=1 Tax=Leptospira gomenensis TaxID=2484974 RepID=A0A5F1YBW8_9LEPT|nr:DUF4254 domain-containing protein [Leptospira gomenensis]TGK35199.1 DUF4254 domain-containing protein [Leptospira gomenensis]TGK37408.1 DUF4254 domain-containing protein [Leptospira gomenensis]TGK41060.1 DUF4254 domain-containing protein [Leptospira gomenensis]TGK61290.1 DUF4254 domain-containing protein [Leptospira gomenensis]